MKNILIALVIVLFASACSRESNARPLRVGASPVPHAAILGMVKPILKKQGIELEIVEMSDYVQPNIAVSDGDLDANFFQHGPYLDQFNRDRGAKLVPIAKVHVEPLGIYSQKIRALAELKEGAVVALPNDPTNGARSLQLLQHAGLIKVREGVALPTPADVTENPRRLQFRELEAAQLPRALPDVDVAVINTNYVLQAGLDPGKDALVREGRESRYANLLVTRSELAEDSRLKTLAAALTSPETKRFLEEQYRGAIVPAF